jgi:hypothetical protein
VDERGRAWAESGAMALSGRPDGPGLGGPPALVDLVAQAADVLDRRSGGRAAVDGLALLGERAALSDLTRHGTISCGGSTRLVRTADGWLAVALARPEDIAALGAWLGADVPPDDPWPAVERMVGEMDAATLDDRAALLGLPMAALSSVGPPATPAFGLPIGADCLDEAGGPPRPIAGALVVDLSALWAGPLCGQLLATAGADVVKVESLARPDGARHGPAAFFDLMNGPKRSVALDLATSGGRRDLGRLVNAADVVIESARPRALEQMGIMAAEELRRPAGPRVWTSITSHGRGPGQAERVGFGDVAAVAGGLVARDEQGLCFLADAVADPLCGLVAAAAVLEALAAGGRWLLSAALAPLAAAVAGPALGVHGAPARPPRARPAVRPAPPLGFDTADVLDGIAS